MKGKQRVREAVVDVNTGTMVSIGDRYTGETLHMEGHCLRCGRCCGTESYKYDPPDVPCKDLIIVDGVYACGLQEMKPFGCKFYPKPEEVKEGCGFRWVKK